MSKFAVDFTICNLPDVRLTDFQVDVGFSQLCCRIFPFFFVRFSATRMAPASFRRLSCTVIIRLQRTRRNMSSIENSMSAEKNRIMEKVTTFSFKKSQSFQIANVVLRTLSL